MRDRGTLTPEQERILRERATKLAALTATDAWQELLAEFSRREQRNVKTITADLVAGKRLQDAQADIDFARGFSAALTWVERLPKQAEDTLERELAALREAQEKGE